MPDPFQLLGLPPSFDLTNRQIEAAYLARVATLHPDSADETAEGIAALNDARAALLNAEVRGQALLETLGGPDAKTCPDLPPTYLVEIMEQRMEIEDDLASNADSARPKWTAWAVAERARIVEGLRPLFAQATRESSSLRRQIRIDLNTLRYIERLIEQLKPDDEHPGSA